MHFLELPLAAFDFDFRHIVSYLIPLAGIILGGVIAVSAMYFKHQQRRLWHETARLALEKGQPIPSLEHDQRLTPPAGPRTPDTEARDLAQHDVRGGLVLVAVGAGLWLFLGSLHAPLRFIGAIPGFIGVALLLYATGRALFSGKKAPRHDATRPS